MYFEILNIRHYSVFLYQNNYGSMYHCIVSKYRSIYCFRKYGILNPVLLRKFSQQVLFFSLTKHSIFASFCSIAFQSNYYLRMYITGIMDYCYEASGPITHRSHLYTPASCTRTVNNIGTKIWYVMPCQLHTNRTSKHQI